MHKEFVHLHVHTDYSLLDGCSRIDRLCERAQGLGMKALAITDHGNVFGWIDFFKTAKKCGVKPLLGCEAYLVYDHKRTERPTRDQAKYYHMGLIAQNATGYYNLVKLVSDAHVQGFYYKPRTDMEMLAAHARGLIGFTGCLQGVVPQALLRDDYAAARKAMGEFIEIFGRDNYFVELQNHGLDEQLKIASDLIKLAGEFNLKIICSNDVHYVEASHWAPHDALLCIQTGSKLADEKRLRYSSHEFYLKSYDEMMHLFGEHPQALTNTCAIAEMCEFDLPFGENHYPIFNQPLELQTCYKDNLEYIQFLCTQGLKERYGVEFSNPELAQDPALAKTLVERIQYELSIINRTGFIDYFLIVWDFIDWARKQTIPVGPGRGSGAGCLVAYLLKITDIDPIRFGLLFERFLNPERVSPPDFDIDFCMRRRAEVIDYVRKKYGKDCVANIITFGTFGAKMVVRDLARVLDLPYSEGDRMAKMVPDDIGITLEEALEKSGELRFEVEHNPTAARIISEGKVIEGMVRNTGTHAAGIIVGDRPLTDLVPVTMQEGALTTQFPKDPLEELGLLKIDFLGLATLTIIADAQANIQLTHPGTTFDIEKAPLDDAATFKLIDEAKTVGVFQIESGGMQSLCRQLQVSKIDEIVALIALYRPGPMDLIPDYIRGKKDPNTIQYPHPLLENVCRETYGIMVYQEQVMEAARLIAGYTLGSADVLRRAMGKKKFEEMEQQRAIFIEGAKKTNDIPKDKAEAIFALLEKFAGYGFNKSHSAAYAILAYRTAYLKANYPVEFMSAVLSTILGNAEKVAHFVEECANMGIPVLGPDVNISRENFTPIVDLAAKTGSIRFGLGAIKGVGDVAAKAILSERDAHGPFKSFEDFMHRVDSRTVNKRVMECLIKSGGFDPFGVDRQHLLDSLESVMGEVASTQQDRERGQASLFDLMEGPVKTAHGQQSLIKTQGPVMAKQEKLLFEKELLGFYISGHPMEAYAGLTDGIDSFKHEEFSTLKDREPYRLCGVVHAITKKLSKKDNRPWAFFQLAGLRHSYSINVYSEAYEQFAPLLHEGKILVITGTTFNNEGEVRLTASDIAPLDQRIGALVRAVTFIVKGSQQADDFLEQVAQWVHATPGSTRILFAFEMEDGHLLHTEIAASLTVKLDVEVIARLRKHPAVVRVQVQCAPVPVPENNHRFRKKTIGQ